MTETYHGPSNPVTGDQPRSVVKADAYHSYPEVNQTGVLNESPFSGAYKVRVVSTPVSNPNEG